MVLDDALGRVRFEGKPQCHIVAIAKEEGDVAISVGCMLSRVRTGMNNNELTCAIPIRRLPEVAEKLRRNARSEEHTSELQSLMRISSAVFCLTKKKNHN